VVFPFSQQSNYFQQRNHFQPAALLFTIVDHAILALLIWWIIKVLKKLWN
jgi:hypothetical protein